MSCCVPPAGPVTQTPEDAPQPPAPTTNAAGLITLGGGRFFMGCAGPMVLPADGEGPVRAVDVARFAIAPLAVSNADFMAFVLDTGHVTCAEATGASMVFAGHLAPDAAAQARAVDGPDWWREVDGACWLHPEGPGSRITQRMDHPAVHIAWADALAYCRWSGTRLPTEPEWEFAARGGLEGRLYPWGDALHPEGVHRCNIWQGSFPHRDLGRDGFCGTAPVRHYPPNGYGLFQMTGNVWEWCSAPAPDRPAPAPDLRPLRGGSHLCHDSYCARYRVSSRLLAHAATATSHIGFRVAADVTPPP